MKTAATLAAIALSLSAALLAQQPPLFRGGVELVEVDAVAIDEHGAAVRGLTRDVHYDLIGYEVPTAQPRKKMHAIDVRTRRPGVEVRARKQR